MMKKKLTKSAQVRALLNIGKTADYIVKKVGCTKTLVHQIDRKMRKESDQKVEAAYAEKVGGNPIPEFLKAQEGPLGRDTFAAWLASKPENDPINPNHYKQHGIETIDIIEAWELNYRLGNVVKYISRAGLKGSTTVTNMYLEDLKKARWYLDREISHNE